MMRTGRPRSLQFASPIFGALAGNAAERAIYASALASEETRSTVGDPLARVLLERLARDPYHAVRRIAERGLAGHMVTITGQLELRYIPFEQLVRADTLDVEMRLIPHGSDFHRLAHELGTQIAPPSREP